MADLRSEAQRIQTEIHTFQDNFAQKVKETEKVFSEFQQIEDKCADMNLDICLEKHDDFKLQRAELLRRRHRMTTAFQKKCVSALPSNWDWEKSLPIISQTDLQSANQFLTCYQPFMQQFLQSASEETALFLEAIRRLRPMVPS